MEEKDPIAEALTAHRSLLESQGPRGDRAAKARPAALAKGPDDVTNHPRPWTKMPRRRKTKLANMGLGKDLLATGDPKYRQCMELAEKFRKARTRELAAIHGFVSSGTSALLASGALALAASRFLYEKAAESGDVDLLKKAAALADSFRQAELAAWELAAREGLVKKKIDAASTATPWVVTDGKAKPGRKTNAERMQRDSVPILPPKPIVTIDMETYEGTYVAKKPSGEEAEAPEEPVVASDSD